MLYLIGLGLADEKDITVKGLEIVREAERVYLEAYTSILLVNHEKLVKGPSLPPPDLQQRQGADTARAHSRKPSMAARSYSRTAKWSNPPATRS